MGRGLAGGVVSEVSWSLTTDSACFSTFSSRMLEFFDLDLS